MNSRIIRHIAGTCIVVLFTAVLTACGGSSSPSAQTMQAVGTTPTSTPLSNITPTSTGSTETGFQQFTGPGFTIKYPSAWQASHMKNSINNTVYSFLYSDNVTGFHVALHTSYVDASSPIAELTNSDMNCNQGDTSLPEKVTANGITWFQSDFLCMLASTYYEVRMLTTDAPLKQQTTIVYGAYQQATASPPFAKANKDYFEPMLQSFQLTKS